MTEALKRYRELEDRLREIRSRRPPGSEEEYPIIEEGAEMWWELNDDERAAIDAEGPTCWPDAFGAIDDENPPIEVDAWGGSHERPPRRAGREAA